PMLSVAGGSRAVWRSWMTASQPRPGALSSSASAATGRGAPGAPKGPPVQQTPAQGEQAVELLERQLAVYQELEELSRRQIDLIEADDTDGLLSLLAARELVLERLTAISAELAPLKADWPQLTEGLSESARQRCRNAIDEIAQVAETLAQRDAHDRAALERRRADVAAELAGLSTGRGAVSAYGALQGPGQQAPRYQDREA